MSPLLQVLAYPCAHPSRLLFPNNFHLAVVNRVSAYPRWPLYFIQFHSGSSSSSKAIALVRFPKSKRHQFHPYLSPLRLGTLQPPIQHSIRKIMSLFPSRLHALSIRNKSITLPCHPSRNTLPSMARRAPFLAHLFPLCCLRCKMTWIAFRPILLCGASELSNPSFECLSDEMNQLPAPTILTGDFRNAPCAIATQQATFRHTFKFFWASAPARMQPSDSWNKIQACDGNPRI